MKIAQIVCSFPPYKGGIGNSAKRLTTLLSPEIEIHTFTTLKSKHRNSTKYDVHYLRPLFKLGQAAILPSLFFKLKKYDVIILHYPFFGTNEILYLYRLFNKKQKLFIYYHMDVKASNIIYRLLSWSGKKCGKALLRQADKVIISSLDYLEISQIRKIYLQNKTKFEAISFHLNKDYFFQNFKVEDTNKIQLVFVGGLDKAHYFKGVDKLITALSKIENKNWNLNIVGNGNLLYKYKKLALNLKINKNINFLTKIDDKQLKKIYEKSDIIILPSLNQNEAFGIVLIEAMANSTAVIASDLKGVSQVFNDKCGLKVTPKSINDLRDKLSYLLNNTKIIESFKQEAFYLAKRRYLDDIIKEKWLNVLNNKEKEKNNK